MSYYILALVFFFSTLISSLPTPLDSADVSAEKWVIPRLNMHMMSTGTGIPGNPPWPTSMRFNSSIDFDILVPDHHSATAVNQDASNPAPLLVNCQAEWVNGTLPDGHVQCTGSLSSDETVWFGMSAYRGPPGTDTSGGASVRRPELSFVLQVGRERVRVGEEGITTSLTGSHAITANNPAESTSYLTCMQGAPYDGLRCKIRSYMSVSTELVIDATGGEEKN